MVDTAEKGSAECTSEFDVAYVQQGAVQSSTGFYFYSLLLWEQLLGIFH